MQERGSAIVYKANVAGIMTEGEGKEMRAVGVRMQDGAEVRAKCVISNATRWDTFGGLLPHVPENEAKFRKRYVKSPSFITLHLGIKADVLPVRLAHEREQNPHPCMACSTGIGHSEAARARACRSTRSAITS